MTNKQPEALRLADALDYYDKYDMSVTGTGIDMQAAALLRTQHAAIERLTEDLAFVERWANHHGAKPHTAPKEALSVIQHYPPIKAITRSYKDGVVPDTFDPYAAIERKDALLRRMVDAWDEPERSLTACYGVVQAIKQELSQ